MIMRAQWIKVYICSQEIPCQPHLSLSATYHSKYVVSSQSEISCFPLSVYGSPLFTRCVISCHLAPAPLSLLLPSCLPTITVSQTLGLKTNLLSHILYMAETVSLLRGSKGFVRVSGAVFLPGCSRGESSRFILVEKWVHFHSAVGLRASLPC